MQDARCVHHIETPLDLERCMAPTASRSPPSGRYEEDERGLLVRWVAQIALLLHPGHHFGRQKVLKKAHETPGTLAVAHNT